MRESTARVHGLRLQDGREVVVKVHQDWIAASFLTVVQTAQRQLASRGFPCPRPLVGPTPLVGGRLATAEELLAGGATPEGHDPAVRKRLAGALAELVALCRDLVDHAGWSQHPMALAPGRRWPRPHDPRFDLAAPGAEWIDEIADGARHLRDQAAGERVVAHLDWRVEHVRFAGESLVAVYDWESLSVVREPVAAGACAHAFCMDWTVAVPTRYPTLDEALAFIADYESARAASFSHDERAVARAALTYSLAYTARCEHSDARSAGDPTIPPGSARAVLQDHA